MRRKKKFKPIYLLIMIGLIIFIAIIKTVVDDKRELSLIEKIASDTLYITGNFVTLPYKVPLSIISEFNRLRTIEKEYDGIVDDLSKFDLINNQNILLQKELDELQAISGTSYSNIDYDEVTATIISRNSIEWHDTIKINKGSFHNIKIGSAVMTSTGLVGSVTNSTFLTSTVKLITSPKQVDKISIIIKKDRNIYGLISSYDEFDDVYTIEGISNTVDIEVGDEVITSGLGEVFPGGISVALVTEVKTDNFDLAKIILAKPVSKFDESRFVKILSKKEVGN